VTGVQRDGHGRVVGVHGHDRAAASIELSARYVVGADGLGSRVARLVGAAINQARLADGAAQYAYYEGVPWAGFEFFVAERSLAGVFPTHDGQACIWVCTPSADAKAVRRRTGSREEAFEQLLQGSAPPSASWSRVTPRPRSCASWWSSRALARRSTTSSPTGCPSPSRSTPPDTHRSGHDTPQARILVLAGPLAGGTSIRVPCRKAAPGKDERHRTRIRDCTSRHRPASGGRPSESGSRLPSERSQTDCVADHPRQRPWLRASVWVGENHPDVQKWNSDGPVLTPNG
jgi:hypothetical protein